MEREKRREENIPFRCKCCSFPFSIHPLLHRAALTTSRQGKHGGIWAEDWWVPTGRLAPCAPRRDEVVGFQCRTPTLKFISPQGLAVRLWQADGQLPPSSTTTEKPRKKRIFWTQVSEWNRTLNVQRQKRELVWSQAGSYMMNLTLCCLGRVKKREWKNRKVKTRR